MKIVALVCALVAWIPVTLGGVAGGAGGAVSPNPLVPDRAALAYRQGARWCPGLRWELLAGIGQVESAHGSHDGWVLDPGTARVAHPDTGEGLFGPPLDGTAGTRRLPVGPYAGRHGLVGPWLRAIGPMQILPGTFDDYGVDGDGDGTGDPHDLDDAAATAARVLCGPAPSMGKVVEALRRYNDSQPYVRRVLAYANRLRAHAAVPGFRCPVVGPTSFTDTWQAPRPGGRRHQGVDIFAPAGAQVVAPVAGEVRFDVHELGGLAFHLWGDDGTYFYGAHLSRFGPAEGRVDAGADLGGVGTTGNAVGTSPHLHFEVHPGRRPGDPARPVNPTPATRAACERPTGSGEPR